MNNYCMTLPNYTIGERAYEDIYRFCSPFGKTAVMIGGKTALSAASEKIIANCGGISVSAKIWYGGESSYENVEILSGVDEVKSADMIFAVGGGKALDTCKCLSDKLGKPVFTFPTVASNCACCTAVAIMYRPDGSFIEPYFFENAPVHAFIDTDIMCAAPEKYLWAGMGDTYAKFYESQISARGEEPEHFKALGLAMSSMCSEPIFAHGVSAFSANKRHVNSEDFKETVLSIAVSTGLVSIMLTRDHTPDYNSGLAHAVFYALTTIGIEEEHLHGEVVAFGTLICLLYDGQVDEYMRVREFNERVGLPTAVSDLGLEPAQLDSLAEMIAGMSDVRHYPYPIDPEKLRSVFAML